jgi:oxygen-independent coproporphyrinogen III oxidase
MTAVAAPSTPYPSKYTTPFLLYPPALWRNAIGSDFAQQHLGLREQGTDYVMYLSVPFCRVRCHSCPYFVDLLSIHDAKTQNKEQRYVEALLADLERWAGYPRFATGRLRAIYIGGGTGSILSPANLKRIIDTVTTKFPLQPGYELTLEGNARDYDGAKLDYVADSPITRISLGVQSFDPAILKVIGSPHAAEQSVTAINELHRRGFRNVQMDMMYNLPGHTRQIWRSDLQRLADLDIEHLTTYLYRIHDGTPQAKFIASGKVQPLLDKESAYVKNMQADLVETAAELGFVNYMFDHYAKPGAESIYNEWTFGRNMIEVLGVGPGAYGFVNDYRIGTAKDVEGYIAAANRGEHLISAVSPKVDDQVRRERYVVNVLQYARIDLDAYLHHFGTELSDDFPGVADKLVDRGLAVLEGRRLGLTALGREWHMNVMLEFTNDQFWGDTSALDSPHWAMNTPMVELFAGRRQDWLG